MVRSESCTTGSSFISIHPFRIRTGKKKINQQPAFAVDILESCRNAKTVSATTRTCLWLAAYVVVLVVRCQGAQHTYAPRACINIVHTCECSSSVRVAIFYSFHTQTSSSSVSHTKTEKERGRGHSEIRTGGHNVASRVMRN